MLQIGKGKIVKDLKKEVTYFRGEVETDGQEQYSRTNCQLIHGLPESKN